MKNKEKKTKDEKMKRWKDERKKGKKENVKIIKYRKWDKWESEYTAMKYSNGQGCWQGPNRSTLIKLECGVSNEIISVEEPAKCEYLMRFKTPAACLQKESLGQDDHKHEDHHQNGKNGNEHSHGHHHQEL